MIADMKVKANLIQVFAPVFFLPVVVIDLGQDSARRDLGAGTGAGELVVVVGVWPDCTVIIRHDNLKFLA